jgi:DNA mismatch repair protein MutL
MADTIRVVEGAPRVRLLPESLVNRIAAGEVIERPAAVVKELIENALDAGATRIGVAIDGGGIARIEVTDDGCGMSPEDLTLSVQRHCTSKLADEQLIRIATLGFRGEALPSIGAAARLSIVSRPRAASNAFRIGVAGGVVEALAPAPGAVGTRVVVEDLFFATPARRKFLKSPRSEAEHAETAWRRLALSAPGVAFRYSQDGRVQHERAQEDRAARLALLGQDASASLMEVAAERNGARLGGFICPPTVHRATAAGQSLVVNGRPVTDPVLRTALRVAYRDGLMAGRFPVVALWLDVPPEELDVNVHPAKTELRFRDPENIRALVIGALQRRLASGAGVAAPRPDIRPALQLVSRPYGGGASGPRFAGFAEAQLPFASPPSASAGLPEAAPDPTHPLGAPVAQVLDTYVLATTAAGELVIVDQHAAHERLTHETLRAQIEAGGIRKQPLLMPAVVDLPEADAARLLEAAPMLGQLGLELEGFGPGAVVVRAMPTLLGAPDPQALVRDIADELAESGEQTLLSGRLEAVIARMACHGSIRAGRRLQLAEMAALLRQMEATPRAATCSHGRPTFLKLSRAEIERLFGRS